MAVKENLYTYRENPPVNSGAKPPSGQHAPSNLPRVTDILSFPVRGSTGDGLY
jgi:hypothetical protein